jgi:hypothetical protein
MYKRFIQKLSERICYLHSLWEKRLWEQSLWEKGNKNFRTDFTYLIRKRLQCIHEKQQLPESICDLKSPNVKPDTIHIPIIITCILFSYGIITFAQNKKENEFEGEWI